MTPKVSVITPIYNVEGFLSQCLASLSRQTLEEIEFICINDGSTDHSLEILQEFARKDDRFVIIDKPNGGYGHTMNKGLDAARGEYIGIVESDDFVDPDAFRALYEIACEHGKCDIVKANYYVHGDKVDPSPIENFPPEICGRTLSPLSEKGRVVLNSIPAIWSAIYRRDFLESNGIRFLETPGAAFQDTGFVFKSWIATDTFCLTHDAYLFYRIDNEGSSVKSAAKALYVCDEFKSIEEFLDRYPDKKKALASRVVAKKFDTYCWNYDRIAESFREDFLVIVSNEMALAQADGLLDESLYTPEEWERLSAILDDPHTVFAQDLEQAARESAAKSRKSPLPAIRDGVEKILKTAERALGRKDAERYPGAEGKTVSIIVPVYNASPFLDKLFDSLLGQTHQNMQIICVNDGSCDDSLAKLESFRSIDSRIEIIDIENSGAGEARNIGIDHATGDYLCFVDADDYIESYAIAHLVDVAERENLDVVLFGIDEYDDKTHKHLKMGHAVVEGKVPYGEVFCPRDIEDFFVNMTGFTVNKLYRMSYFEKIDVKFPKIGAHEDMPFTYAAVEAADRVFYLDEILYHYRLDRAESRSETTASHYQFMLEALECMQDELKRLGLWDEVERDFVNYALWMCYWKFNSLERRKRRAFYNALFDEHWLERLGILGRSSSYYYTVIHQKFYLALTTATYTDLIEDANRFLADELEEVVESKSFKLGNFVAEPTRRIRSLVHPDKQDA